jgi:hypothetical protein
MCGLFNSKKRIFNVSQMRKYDRYILVAVISPIQFRLGDQPFEYFPIQQISPFKTSFHYHINGIFNSFTKGVAWLHANGGLPHPAKEAFLTDFCFVDNSQVVLDIGQKS